MTIRILILTVIFVTTVVLINSCNTKPKLRLSIPSLDSTIKPTKISIENLARNYKSYQGKYIETTGLFYQAFEEFAIYAHKPFFGERKGFWLENNMNLYHDLSFFEKINGKTITIKGIVDTASRGHLSMYLATIRRIYFWEKY